MFFSSPYALLALGASTKLASAALTSGSDSACKQVQFDFPAETNKNDPRAEAVKQAYLREWDQYTKYAWPNDDLLALSHNYTNDIYGWGASIVDGISTAIVMGLTDVVEEQLAHIASINFDNGGVVDYFNVNIRYLAGLLGAYDLLKSGQFPYPYNQEHVEALLSQAKTLATLISPVFDTATGLPAAQADFSTGKPVQSPTTIDGVEYNVTNCATGGTMILEYSRLSDLTGDESFRRNAQRAEEYLINPTPEPKFPGLVGTQVNTDTGEFLTLDAGWQSGVDSFIEYLIKTYVYSPDDEMAQDLLDFWEIAVDSTAEHLALHPHNHPDLTYITQLDPQGNFMWTMDDYACFAGGNLLLGGVYLDRPDIYELGVNVADGCHNSYNTTVTGLGPFLISWYNETNGVYKQADDTAENREYASENGYFIKDSSYGSFPESLESFFYAYRITGDQRWQDYNWEIFQALNTSRSESVPYAEISDVNAPYGGQLKDYVPSFYFAEVLKYLYLTFTEPNVISLDEWVFTTEAHPLLIQNGTCSS